MRISDWSSDVCSSDLQRLVRPVAPEADGDRPAVTLVEEVADEDVAILRGRAFQRCVGKGEFVNGHGLAPLRLAVIPSTADGMTSADRCAACRGAFTQAARHPASDQPPLGRGVFRRSEEHTSELQSLMRISYAVFCL